MGTFTRYQTYLDKLNKQCLILRKKPLPQMQILSDLLNNYQTFTKAQYLSSGLSKLSKEELISFRAFLIGIHQHESSLGFLSPELALVLENLSQELTVLLFNQVLLSEKEILKNWLYLIILLPIGLLYLDDKTQEKNLFYQELILILLINSNYSTLLFQEMAQSLNLEKAKTKILETIFEIITLFIALFFRSNKEELFKEELLDTVTKRLEEKVIWLENHLNQDYSNLILFLKTVQLNLEKQDHFALEQTLTITLEEGGYSQEILQRDFQAIKNFFKNLLEAYYAAISTKTNRLQLIG